MTLKQAYIICLLVFVALCFLLPQPGRYDTSFWVDWARGMQTTGLAHAYSIDDLNYNPLYLYIIRAYAYFVSPEGVEPNINVLKILTLIFDVGAVMFLMRWLKQNHVDFFAGFFILFNIAYLYNTLCWGQIDAIHTTLVFVAFVMATQQKFTGSVLFYLLALNVKTQAILFLPPLLLLWLPLMRLTTAKTYVKTLLWVVGIQTLILLPFILKGTIGNVWDNLVGVVDYNPFLSMRAYNFWYVAAWEVEPDIPRHIADTNTYFGIAAKTWGFVLFFISSALALLPILLKAIIYTIKRKTFAFANAELVFLALTLVAILFFYFPTQMHERYSHPAVLFAGIYFVLSRRWVIFLFTSYAYLMNLEAVDKCWKLKNYHTLIFDPRLIAGLYGVAIALGILQMYRSYNFKGDWVEFKEALFSKSSQYRTL